MENIEFIAVEERTVPPKQWMQVPDMADLAVVLKQMKTDAQDPKNNLPGEACFQPLELQLHVGVYYKQTEGQSQF